MSTAPLQAAIASTRAELAAVRPEHLGLATPCQSWKVHELINHVVGAQHFFLAVVEGAPPSGAQQDFASGDYLGAFDDISVRLVAAFAADGVMDKVLTAPFGQVPGRAFIGFAVNDTFVHGWDLARSTGRSTDLAPELAAGVLVGAKATIPAAMRGEDGKMPFGPIQDAPTGASNADKLAAFLGRIV